MLDDDITAFHYIDEYMRRIRCKFSGAIAWMVKVLEYELHECESDTNNRAAFIEWFTGIKSRLLTGTFPNVPAEENHELRKLFVFLFTQPDAIQNLFDGVAPYERKKLLDLLRLCPDENHRNEWLEQANRFFSPHMKVGLVALFNENNQFNKAVVSKNASQSQKTHMDSTQCYNVRNITQITTFTRFVILWFKFVSPGRPFFSMDPRASAPTIWMLTSSSHRLLCNK